MSPRGNLLSAAVVRLAAIPQELLVGDVVTVISAPVDRGADDAQQERSGKVIAAGAIQDPQRHDRGDQHDADSERRAHAIGAPGTRTLSSRRRILGTGLMGFSRAIPRP